MFGIFGKNRKAENPKKSAKDPEKAVEEFNREYSGCMGNLCILGNELVVFRGFEIEKGKRDIRILYHTPENVRMGTIRSHNYDWFLMRYDARSLSEVYQKSRKAYLKLRSELKDFGFDIVKVSGDD